MARVGKLSWRGAYDTWIMLFVALWWNLEGWLYKKRASKLLG